MGCFIPNNLNYVKTDDVPDICGFLDGKKQSVDNDPETNPFDDVRHYAYEGDGNTTGSLSSLASGKSLCYILLKHFVSVEKCEEQLNLYAYKYGYAPNMSFFL